jgi:hypothetical protein
MQERGVTRSNGAMRGGGAGRWEAVAQGEVAQQLARLEAQEAMAQQEVNAPAGGGWRCEERQHNYQPDKRPERGKIGCDSAM